MGPPAAPALPVVPGAHQGVLQHRQIVAIVADFVQQPEHQPRRDGAARHGDRTGDRRTKLVAGHPRHEVLALVQGLGQPRILHAVADEVGAHGQHDVDRQLALRCRLEQQLDKATASSRDRSSLEVWPEPKQLLELIDEHEHVVVLGDLRLPDRLDQPERTTAQRGLEHHAVVDAISSSLRSDDVCAVERLGQLSDGIARPAA